MPVIVPTMEDYKALDARIARLETAALPPTHPVQAGRIADLVEMFGVNTFSSDSATANLWGSWPADYSAPTVIAALNWLTAASGFSLRGREYHYAGRETMQGPWFKAVVPATGTRFSICIGANGGMSDVASMLALAADPANGIAWVEGLNEPNNNFGSGVTPIATTVEVQKAVSAGLRLAFGPSIVIGLPLPENWISGYASANDLAALNANMACANGHFYPPSMVDADDGSGRGGALDDVVAGFKKIYPDRPLMLTEFHPTLYSKNGVQPGGTLDAYYTLLTLLSSWRHGVRGLWWYALFDYRSVYICGLFATNATAPRPAAYAIRALCSLTGDHGVNKRTFSPGSLGYTVSGLPAGGHHDLFQSSDGRFFIMLYNAQVAAGGASTPVTVTFDVTPASVKEYNISLGISVSPLLQSVVKQSAVVSNLDASVRLLVVVP